ncbi:YtxH domain-containing protein [Paenisporosarcina quisquiliarum]|uniref:YtxH domain-containing protein n=1 Tax=Paenisporosarcina quisquiliarum TaxID=365346 RepID=A0A9X3LFI1_9BACL|nr:YtxH domain-containing protein [Paenisporosarcina quisquiliarum]MCZ8536996.1 YtxH domain-containing protein [Paenisporosarcina quisquiliarum]
MMNESKLFKGMVVGALAGAGMSLLDRATREDVKYKLKTVSSDVKYYSKNREDLRMKLQETADKLQTVYNQFSQDAQYLSGKVEELKTLTPQVKTLVVDTKEAFEHSKEEYKTIVKDEEDEFTMPVLPEHVYEEKKFS